MLEMERSEYEKVWRGDPSTEKSMKSLLLLTSDIVAGYSSLPQVEAVVLAGSQTSGTADQDSDIDLYVYSRAEIPVSVRASIAMAAAEYPEVDNRFWEPGDEWVDAGTGIHVDVMFRFIEWIEEQLERVLQRHEARVGYSTCFWHNVLSSQILYDRNGWFRALQEAANQPYPESLRRAIIAKNQPILRRNMSSYLHQLERAVVRGDLVSINHRVAALLASYFDILFAVNRLPHPGEKRLVEIASEKCAKVPAAMSEQVRELIHAGSQGDQRVIEKASVLIDGLDDLLSAEGLDPAQG
jgi:predicted nucleotidyltransferase